MSIFVLNEMANWCMCMYNSTVCSRFICSCLWQSDLCSVRRYMRRFYTIISYPRCSIIDVSVFVVATAIAAADVAVATFVWINIAWIIVSFVYKIWESQEIVVAFSYFTGFSNSFWPWTYMYFFSFRIIYGIGNIGASYLLMHIIKQSTRNISKFKFIQLINLSYCSHKPLSQASKFSNFHVSRHVKIRTKATKRKRNEMKRNVNNKKKRMKNKIVKIQQSVDKSKSFKPHWWYCFPLTVWWIRVCCWECKSNPTHILQWDTKQTSNPHHLQHFFYFLVSLVCAFFVDGRWWWW